jgi:hypothetical protein
MAALLRLFLAMPPIEIPYSLPIPLQFANDQLRVLWWGCLRWHDEKNTVAHKVPLADK